MFKNIPCYFHPTTPVFIDDDAYFLTALTDELRDRWICKTFTHPQEALKCLQEAHPVKHSAHFCLNSLEDEIPEHRFTDLDIQAIGQQLYSLQRFGTLAVVIVDYTMPGLNGLDLCSALMSTSYKKILLTGAADEKIAVEAFNQGLIQGYLRKEDPLLVEQLRHMIATLERAYFFDISKVVTDNMAVNSLIWGLSLFNTPYFAHIFHAFYEKQQPVEYYLSALTGSFLFVDAQGHSSELAIVDEGIMQMFEDFINEAAPACNGAFSGLKNRAQLLAHHPKLVEKPVLEWLPYLYPAQKIITQEQCYYYSTIEQVTLPDFHPEAIVSYQSYLQNQTQKVKAFV